LAQEGHAVLQAPPGAGKTTVVPLRLLDEPWLEGGRIVVLEPRRLATRAAARRMAALLGEQVGQTVGFRTRDEGKVGRATRVEVVTEGILTRRLQRDPSLPGVGLVVFDEVHERNLQADLGLALALDARAALRPDLRVLAMSATVETGRVAALLGGDAGPAPAITSEGRAFPVEVRWQPAGPRDRPAEWVAQAVRQALASETGDLLVFLAGAADIRRVQGLLSADARDLGFHLRPLFGALTPQEQDAALSPAPDGGRRVVLATDIAETSLTVEGVRVVVDSGQVRTPQYDPRTGLTRLRTGATSRASAHQRAGRAGRTEPGVAIRLWSQAEHGSRRPFALPEIATVDLAGFALEVALWGAAADDLALLDPPPAGPLAAAQDLLVELGATDERGQVTAPGRQMAELPVHPRLARMVVGARSGDGAAGSGLREACAVAALLEERDVLRGRPHELPADVGERVRLIVDERATHPGADRDALRLVRRRAKELARRVGGEGGAGGRGAAVVAVGPLLALAYPDRLAQARGGGRFVLRHGAAAWLPEGDPLTAEQFLVVAALGLDREGEQRITMAAGLDLSDLEAVAGADVTDVEELVWDPARNDLRRRAERRLGAIVLASDEGAAPVGEPTVAALLDHVGRAGLGALRWTDAARSLQGKVAFARSVLGPDWPDVSDPALLASLPEWLGPRLLRATRRADLEKVDVLGALRDLIGHHRLPELDRLLPRAVVVASGREVPIDYSGEQPAIAVRVQDLYGTTTHPAIAGGRVPLVVSLLSPAGRPVQITNDLPGFWAGSWKEVRKDMAGRYPKHDWPLDPATAEPSKPRGSRRRPSR
jgi:ATP-dependent helicase HrpB